MAHGWTGGGEVSGWSTGSEERRRLARFEEVGTHHAMGRRRVETEMVASDDGDGVDGALDGDGCGSLNKELRVMALLLAVKKMRGSNGGGSHHQWRWWCMKHVVGKTRNAASSEKLGRNGELMGHEDTIVHSLDY
jgi:hypothetical protein